MSTATNFISELIRAANEASNLTVVEKGRLLGRALVTIRELKAGTGHVVDPLAFDETLVLQAAAATIDTLLNDAVKATFLDAAETLRTLKFALDAKAEAMRDD
jgi:hypothetical protein